MAERERAAVLGAGHLGLSAAYALGRAGVPVRLFDAGPGPWGVNALFEQSWRGLTARLPKAYRIFAPNEADAELLAFLGLDREYYVKRAETSLWREGWKLRYRLRSLTYNLKELARRADVPAAVRLSLLPRVVQNFRFDGDDETVAMGGLRCGFAAFVDRLESRLAEAGVEFVPDARIESVDFEGGELRWRRGQERFSERFSAAVSALPPEPLAAAAKRLAPALRERLGAARYPVVTTACVGLRGRLGPDHVVTVQDDGMPVQEIVDYTDEAGLGEGLGVAYLVSYASQTAGRSDEELREPFLACLERVVPRSRSRVEWLRFFRAPNPRALPVIAALPWLSERLVGVGRSAILFHEFDAGPWSGIRRFSANVARWARGLDRSRPLRPTLLSPFGLRAGRLVAARLGRRQ